MLKIFQLKKVSLLTIALKQQIEDTKDILDPDLFQPKIEKEKVAILETED